MGGSTLTSVGLTSLGRAFVIIGEGAGISLGIYDMVQTPGAIPLDLFGIVMSGKGIRDVGNVRKAAKVRRTMDRVSIERMSKRVAEQTERLKSVVEKNARALDVCVKYAEV
ncbi:hypothetical protein NW762_014677 [Fusarium torreyae]|uniref:Uncharacterized protein n=1 Tax=Fusarium torreyae TaxID=1237075 RepID=A0A9W8RL63_9HYPO|nr:hypothetical protein NW762_014677 [Fusarium torreyae]